MDVDTLVLRAPRDIDPTLVAPSLEATPVTRHATRGVAVSYSESFAFRTSGVAPAFFDVTTLVRGVVQRSGVQQGQVLAAVAHTTCALIVQENEPLLLAGFFRVPDELGERESPCPVFAGGRNTRTCRACATPARSARTWLAARARGRPTRARRSACGTPARTGRRAS